MNHIYKRVSRTLGRHVPGWMHLLNQHPSQAYQAFYYKLIARIQLTFPVRALFPAPVLLYLPPSSIIYRTKIEFYIHEFTDTVLSGDWDIQRPPFEEMNLNFYDSAKMHFLEGKPWLETPYHKGIMKAMKEGKIYHSCFTNEDLEERCRMLDAVFDNIKVKGCRPQGNKDEIGVNIARDGTILFNNGRHRLTFAKLLKLDRVPVRINVRHRLWHDFKRRIKEYTLRHGGKVRFPLLHPDLKSVPSSRGHELFDIIRSHVPINARTLLDINAQWGYFCHRFEDLGLKCVAIEKDPDNLYFLRKLRDAEGKNFEIVSEPIINSLNKKPPQFDVILMFDLFDHFSKIRIKQDQIVLIIKTLKPWMLFFETQSSGESQEVNIHKCNRFDRFIESVQKHGLFPVVKCIGKTIDGKTVYGLSRKSP